MQCSRCARDVPFQEDLHLDGIDGGHASMLEVAVLSGDAESACSLVERGTRTYVLNDIFLNCQCTWGVCPYCVRSVASGLVAVPEVRATAAAAARRSEIRVSRCN